MATENEVRHASEKKLLLHKLNVRTTWQVMAAWN
jgi:hypothetical protein